MSRKYIQEYQNKNFVYPNNQPWEYGDEIIHDINNNSISGTVTSFVSTLSGGNISISFSYTWSKNGAEPFIREDGTVSILSVHMMDKTIIYFKPWRLVSQVSDSNVNVSTKSGSLSFTVTPSMLGVSSFSAGTYYLEVRMIGKREVYPICITATVA